jgi:anti-anti-sigma factor
MSFFRGRGALLVLNRTDFGKRLRYTGLPMIDRTLETKTASFKLVGDWDFSRRHELQTILRPAESADEVLLDFSEVTFIDASVLSCLMRLRNLVMKRNCFGAIRIVAASRNASRIFEICKLHALFGLPESVDALVSTGFATSPVQRGMAFMTA